MKCYRDLSKKQKIKIRNSKMMEMEITWRVISGEGKGDNGGKSYRE